MANKSDALHDYHVTSVMADAVEKAVVIRAAYPDRRGPEFAEAVYHGVAAYRFDGDALGTILFEIVEVDPVGLYLRYAGPMQKTVHQCGGHAPWTETEQQARHSSSNANCVGSSYNQASA
ncbi:hypothetical protein HED60_15830 [Planctomycetales bacterium ZRK34]|nr:hypothetical protein HED60_15830 [Planctomycetales bacterium ZRK34]